MSHNRFGHLFCVTSWGESHGAAIGCVIDGTPPQIPLTTKEIQYWLNRRRPGHSRFVSQRKETDQVEILSGVFEGQTTGTPISLLIKNTDQRSRDYEAIKEQYRPSHADWTYDKKYGIRDYRGGGRASARETATRVAAGAIARKIIPNIKIRAALVEIGGQSIDRKQWDWNETEKNDLWCPDAQKTKEWEELLLQTRKAGSSVGAVIEIVASPMPIGLGAPVYGKLDADLAAALMSINAVKAVEIGAGITAARMRGEDNTDQMKKSTTAKTMFLSNHAGGVLGGISSGADLVIRFAVKPTSSILTPQTSLTRSGEEVSISTKGRHDPCVGIRAAPVGEAMVACILADHFLRHRAQMGES